MAYYTPQDKKDFLIKDIKYAVGQGMGNAFSKAVDYVISLGLKGTEAVVQIESYRDVFFKSNQEAIQEAFEKWLEENEQKVDEALGITNPGSSPKPL